MAQYSDAILLIIVLAAWEIVKWMIPRFMKKTVGTQYVTVAQCNENRKACGVHRDRKNDDLFNLIRGLRSEVKQLRILIVKHMLRSNAPTDAIEEALESRGKDK